MFKENDEKYIKRLIGRNEVVLFLGSGFSLEAENKLNKKFSTGRQLGEKIWDFLGYKDDYDNTSLPEMYQAFINAGISKGNKKEFLNNNLLSGEVPEKYNSISKAYWYKIYTLNIDDILDKVYKRTNKKVKNVIYPKDEYIERDQSLEYTNIIYLHGKLPCEPDEVVFSTKQYAKSQLSHQPLYGQFVYDYAIKPTIFVGTDLNEPIFEKYIESREGREGYAERRPKSFLISPSLSPVKIDNLKSTYNVHHIKGTIDDFLLWLDKISNDFPIREVLLRDSFPNLLDISEYASLANVEKKILVEFAKSFVRVPTDYIIKENRSAFLQGATPSWNDIYKDIDIPRTITSTLQSNIENIYNIKSRIDKIHLINFVGTAGSGKSTILKRLGLQLSQNGRTVFITDCEFIPKNEQIFEVLMNIKERVILIFDNAKNAINQIISLINELHKLETLPIILISLRNNQQDKLHLLNQLTIDRKDVHVPNLDDIEIENLISKLDNYNLLGILKGKSDVERTRAFKYKAKKQILIALKEATNGKNFDEIIQDEYDNIEPVEAKILCACVALNTELGYTNSKQDFIGFSKVEHSEALNYLHTTLAGTIIWTNPDKFMIRHSMIAEYFIKFCVNIEILKESYIRVLSILAPELKKNHSPSRKFNLYKSLINHNTLYNRFRNNIEHAREIYESISYFFDDDYQYWLQYGCLEIEGVGGDLSLAENYINQAESINYKNTHIQNAKCNLYYRKSYFSSNYSEALDYKNKADELALKLMSEIGSLDPHIHHIRCNGNFNFIEKWITDRKEKEKLLRNLKKEISNAVDKHQFDKKLEQTQQEINRAYLQLGINI